MTVSSQEFGGVQADVATLKKDSARLSKSNENRKEEISEIKYDFQAFQHIVEETKTAVEGISITMQEILEEIREIRETTGNMEQRIEALEDGKFDSSKFWGGVYDIFKTRWPWITIITLSMLMSLLIKPEIGDTLSQIFSFKPAKE